MLFYVSGLGVSVYLGPLPLNQMQRPHLADSALGDTMLRNSDLGGLRDYDTVNIPSLRIYILLLLLSCSNQGNIGAIKNFFISVERAREKLQISNQMCVKVCAQCWILFLLLLPIIILHSTCLGPAHRKVPLNGPILKQYLLISNNPGSKTFSNS